MTIDNVRKIKHLLFIMQKNRRRYLDRVYRFYGNNFPISSERQTLVRNYYGVEFAKYSTFTVNHLLWNDKKTKCIDIKNVPPVIFCVWFGEGSLSEKREKSLSIIRENAHELKVVLITSENLSEWVVDDHPLPEIFSSLSAIHKSDYLRAYLMHHYGGVYLDVKTMRYDWRLLIESINSDSDIWAGGGPEESSANLGPASHANRWNQMAHYNSILYQAAFACRPNTPFTQEWIEEVNRRLRYYEDLLERSPALDARGQIGGYPVEWKSLLSEIFSPLSIKYSNNIIIDDEIKFDYSGGFR